MNYALTGGSSTGSWTTPVVRTLLWTNAAIFLTHLFTANVIPWGYVYLSPELVMRKGYVWQIFTYMYVHYDMFHLLWNVFGLFMFGPDVERVIGSRKFFVYYSLCGVGGAALAIVAYPHSNIIGASGAFYGILLAYAVFFPYRPILMFLVTPVESRWVVLLYGVIDLVGGIQGTSGVAHFAHLGGLLTGMCIFFLSGRLRFPFMRTSAGSTRPSLITQWISKVRTKRAQKRAAQERLSAAELDALLDKIAREGMGGLTKKERERLKSASQAMKSAKD